MWDSKKLKEIKFNEFQLETESSKIVSEIGHIYYNKINSIEFWNPNTAIHSINQIKFAIEANLFRDKKLAILVSLDLIKMMNHLKLMAEVGVKIDPNNKGKNNNRLFKLYIDDTAYSNNIVFATSGNFKRVYSLFDNPNFMFSESKALVNYTENYLKRMESRSTLISTTSERHRIPYFDKLVDSIDRIKKGIESDLSFKT